MFDTFDYCDRQYVVDELESAKRFQRLLEQSTLFPDDMHVVGPEYQKLASRLLDMIQ